MKIRPALPSEMKTIDEISLRFDLDSNDTAYEQFLVAEIGGRLAGFGRLIQRKNAMELGTVGVLEEYRGKGVAAGIVQELIKKAGKKALYLTTLIPSYFKRFGFEKMDTPAPKSMIRKKEWCDGCKQVGCTLMHRSPK